MTPYKFITSIILLSFLASSCSKNVAVAQKDNIESKIEALLSKMSLDEKIGQTAMRGTSSRVKILPEELKIAVREGRIGSFLNVMNMDYVNELQRIAVEESPNKIPLIFSRDVIHGFKTIFPIPLGQAATWNPETVKEGSRIAAFEASSAGIRWTFAPMLDIANDSRWGRIAESPGEDPYLASILAKAYVQGFQSDDLSSPTNMLACAKHFIGYGAGIGGRDYNTAIIDDATLQNLYLPPFQAAINAGAQTVMSSFNELNGVPASGNKHILTDILRGQMKFDGFVVSDWNSVSEMIAHGYAEDEKQAAEIAANAGLDMEMTSKTYENNIKQLIAEGKLPIAQLEFYVKNILRVKYRLGLFEKPFKEAAHTGKLYSNEHLMASKNAAIESAVLLKNNNHILPLKMSQKLALIGPLADASREQLGTWTFDGEADHSVTPFAAMKSENVVFVPGLTFSRDKSNVGFKAAVDASKNAEVIVFIGGEEAILSGEAHSRADIKLPGAQESLIKELAATGKPIVLVIMAGRPIDVTNIIEDVDALIMAWHPGTMAGPAIHDLLYGIASPSGRLPVTWPKTAGQLPLFYNHKNTGRPADSASFVQMDAIPIGAWQSSLGNNSHYLDVGFTPQFPFGFGLSYSTFSYTNLTQSSKKMTPLSTITFEATITNTGGREAEEVVQFYVRDLVGSITRPVKELKGFQKINLAPGGSKKVSFTLHSDELKFVNNTGKSVLESGQFKVWIGPNAAQGLQGEFELTK